LQRDVGFFLLRISVGLFIMTREFIAAFVVVPLVVGIVAGAGPKVADAQNAASDARPEKRFQIARDTGDVVVDGVLDEAAWSRATRIDDLHQIDPFEFAEPSQATEIFIYYDDNALYVGARLWDSDADQITANALRQGEGLASEDRFSIIIDPYLDRRSGYRFQVNPNGVRWDALYKDTSSLESNWEGIWEGAATRDGEGWTAEMAIPFKTLSFNPNTSDWGMNFERAIQRAGESIGWVSRNRQLNPGVAGTASGFEGLEQGLGLDIVPSVSVSRDRIYATTDTTRSDLEPSVDIFYKITPSLNGALTINTDFSATEVDDRQVNLTRFSLFFPEKRDFFLQDADIFEFGRIGGGGFSNGRGRGAGGGGGIGNPAIPQSAAQNARPFFSRRLGLSATGQPVDIEYGGKISGRAGRWNLGALAIRQDQFEATLADDIFVGRVTANVLGESAVGFIMTDGDPRSNLGSSLFGTDFRYRNSRLPGGRLLEAQGWYQESDNEGVEGKNRAFGAGFSLPNATGWQTQLSTRTVEENYFPAVGFIDRVGIRDYGLVFGYRGRFRDRYWRSAYAGVDAYRVDDLATGRVASESFGLRFTFQNNTQDSIFSRLISSREVLTEDFVIFTPSNAGQPGAGVPVVIPPGDYSFSEYRIGIQGGNQRRIAVRASVSGGEFYNGDRLQSNAEINWRPSERYQFGINYQVNNIELPTGNFIVRISSLRAQWVFSNTLSWVNLFQYDNVSETVGFNSRLHWIPRAGREGFIVVNHNLEDRNKNDSFHSAGADFSVKFSYTFRF
jgi:hypothetical protein